MRIAGTFQVVNGQNVIQGRRRINRTRRSESISPW